MKAKEHWAKLRKHLEKLEAAKIFRKTTREARLEK